MLRVVGWSICRVRLLILLLSTVACREYFTLEERFGIYVERICGLTLDQSLNNSLRDNLALWQSILIGTDLAQSNFFCIDLN